MNEEKQSIGSVHLVEKKAAFDENRAIQHAEMENSIEYEIAGGQIASFAVAFRDTEKNGNVLGIVRKNVEEIGRKEVRVCFAEFVVEKVFFVVGNRTRKRTRRQLVDAGFGGGEGVESEERVISRQIFTIEANTFQIARIVREIEEVITD